MTAEILSIIAVCISGITAVCSATIPAILNYRVKKEELRDKKKREETQAYEAKFKEFYQAHLKVLKEFSELYIQWGGSTTWAKKYALIDYIYKIAPEFRLWLKNRLLEFASKVENHKTEDNIDEYYQNCVKGILHSYGVNVSSCTPDIFMSDMLKVVLREQFDKLQHATSKDFHFHKL